MILDVYGAECRSRFSGSVVLDVIVLAHHLPKFEGPSVFLEHLHPEDLWKVLNWAAVERAQTQGNRASVTVPGQVDTPGFVRALLGL